MLHQFLSDNRLAVVNRCRMKSAARSAPPGNAAILLEGIPDFVDQVIKTLRLEQSTDPMQSRKVSGPAGGGKPVLSEVGETAARHGRELLREGFTVDQVVHSYGDVCQSVTDLALEQGAPVSLDEFRTLNRCLDNAIADAVSEFNYQQTTGADDQQELALNQRLGFFAHELRNLLNSATLALTAIKTGNVGLTGATAAVLDRSLIGLRSLIDRSLCEVRIKAGLPVHHRVFSLADFISEMQGSAALEARSRGCTLLTTPVDPSLAVDADRDLLFSSVGNLLQNGFKFTHPGSEITLSAYASADRVLIDVSDHCGGLPDGAAENLFVPFTQSGKDKSGLGLGLSIARRSVEANLGTLTVRDIPGTGCVFTIDLPRHDLSKVPAGNDEEPLASKVA